jgi:hypothetical protein
LDGTGFADGGIVNRLTQRIGTRGIVAFERGYGESLIGVEANVSTIIQAPLESTWSFAQRIADRMRSSTTASPEIEVVFGHYSSPVAFADRFVLLATIADAIEDAATFRLRVGAGGKSGSDESLKGLIRVMRERYSDRSMSFELTQSRSPGQEQSRSRSLDASAKLRRFGEFLWGNGAAAIATQE